MRERIRHDVRGESMHLLSVDDYTHTISVLDRINPHAADLEDGGVDFFQLERVRDDFMVEVHRD
jgi:hypothetical protein